MTVANYARQFNEDGFVVVPNLFSDDELAPIAQEVSCILQGGADYMPAGDLVYEPESSPPQLRNAFRMHLYNELFLAHARNPKLLPLLEAILGSPVRLYGSQLFAKLPRVGSAVPIHQDMPYWPFSPFKMLTAWIALDDSTLENGCVRFVRGSHRLGLLPHLLSGITGNSLGLASDPRVEALPEIPVEVRRGSCVLHHCLTVHRSEPNQSAEPRRGLIYIYMAPDVQLTDPTKLKGSAYFPVIS